MKMRSKILIGLILIASAASIAFAAGNMKSVTIKDLTGVVDIKKAGMDSWVPAERGVQLTSGDSIRTTLDSAADIMFENGSVIRLDEETTLGVEELAENVEKARFLYFFDRNVTAKKTKLKLDEGNITAAIAPIGSSKSKFTVETPRGIAGVRGTNWYISMDKIGVQSGQIKWYPKGKSNTDGGTAGPVTINEFAQYNPKTGQLGVLDTATNDKCFQTANTSLGGLKALPKSVAQGVVYFNTNIVNPTNSISGKTDATLKAASELRDLGGGSAAPVEKTIESEYGGGHY